MKRLLAPLFGAVYCLGFAPFGLWPAVLLGAAGLYWLLVDDFERPVLTAWLFGVGKYGVGASWVYVSINVYGNAPPPLAGLLVLLFVLGVAMLFALPLGWLFARLRTSSDRRLVSVLLFAAAWTLCDWLSTWLLTGFPWLLPAHAMLATPLGGWIPVLGSLGTGFIVVLLGAALVGLWPQGGSALPRTPREQVLLGAWLAPWLLGAMLAQVAWTEAARTHSVALVQGNLDQARKWLPEERIPNVRKHLRLSEAHWEVDLLIWPEAAVTLFGAQAELVLERLNERARENGTSLVVGMPVVEGRGEDYRFYNSVLGLGEASGRFDKHHLVPFCEYVPLEQWLRGTIEFFNLPMSSTSPGPAEQPNIASAVGPLAVAVCYEVAYGETLRLAARDAAALVTVTNDSWFGASIGPHQHMQIAQVRAAENGRWLLRATNNGVTAIVDHRGRRVDELPQFEAGVLSGEVQARTGRTPYSFLGDWPVLLLLFSTAVFAFARRRARP